MLKRSRGDAGSWSITEEDAAFRILDAAGKVLAEIPFAHRSASNLSRNDARQMAEHMLAAGGILSASDEKPKKREDL